MSSAKIFYFCLFVKMLYEFVDNAWSDVLGQQLSWGVLGAKCPGSSKGRLLAQPRSDQIRVKFQE